MGVYVVDPLVDPRWDEFLLRHDRATVFHTRRWLSALHATYGYRPVVFSTSAPSNRLENGIVFCAVKSWITGRRLVSLPFSDHCGPLVNSPAEHTELLAHIRDFINRACCKYAEIRTVADERSTHPAPGLQPGTQFFLHVLSLDPPLDSIFRGLHKDCIQRKIRRAEREELGYTQGRSEGLLREFYELLIKTRRRHGLPPQPIQWFRHLISSMGDHLTIRIALKNGHPVAAILTLAFQGTVTYKYGCSDRRFNHLGGVPFLLWKTIQEAKKQGMHQLDLGRSDVDNPGLATFKDRLGAKRTELQYHRLFAGVPPQRPLVIPESRALKWLANRVPIPVLGLAGRFLYRHMG